MDKELRKLKTLIISSGKQINNFFITKEAINDMYSQNNEGKPLIDAINFVDPVVCGTLSKTELVYNKEKDEMELWGYFIYIPNGTPFDQFGKCCYEISYDHKDFDKNRVMHKCSLVGCTMRESLY